MMLFDVFQERIDQFEKTRSTVQFGMKSYFISHAFHLLTYSADHLSTLVSEVFVDNVLKKKTFF